MSQTLGEILAILAALCGATSSLLYNRLGKKATADVLACIRMEIAAPIMCTYALLVDGFILPTIESRALVVMVISGIIGFFITDLFMFRAYVSWGARETMVVLCLTPVFSAIASYFFFQETLTFKQIAGSLCSLLGVVIMTLGDRSKGSSIISKGAIIALFAAIFQSMSDMTAKFALSDTPWVTTAAIRGFSGMVAWVIYRQFCKKPFIESKDTVHKPKFFAILTLTVIIGTVTGTTLAMGALKSAPAGIVTSLKQISPIFILAYEFLILRKKLSLTDVLGTFVSVFGVFLLF